MCKILYLDSMLVFYALNFELYGPIWSDLSFWSVTVLVYAYYYLVALWLVMSKGVWPIAHEYLLSYR